MIGEKTLETLEFVKIREMLAARCETPLGVELALNLRPATDPEVVRAWQEETAEAEKVLRQSAPPLSSVRDLRPLLERARAGGRLSGLELGHIGAVLAAVRAFSRFSGRLGSEFPRWKEIAKDLTPMPDLEEALSRSIGPDGSVLDSASPALARIRQERRVQEARLKEKLEGFLRDPAWQNLLQDLVITQRNNRYVLLVKQEHRHRFPGIVHGQSASGATLFIEPLPVVELNNRLRLLEDQEEEEVIRILTHLTEEVARRREPLCRSLEALGRLDFLLAKARLAADQEAVAPAFNPDGRIRLRAARHPLLPREKVVPVDVELGTEFDILVVTGPNTGGKTVSLKTVGLLVLMAQAGLFLPAGYGSEVSVFAGVYADIGDEQSIEQSLSTFSSHMKNIASFLRELELPALVLLDEIGAGTDPAEGAALAQGILEYLRERGAKAMVTTHLGELKLYAHRTPRAANAAVEFDSVRLLPTYRLLLGLPGRSNALEIAETLGCPKPVVEKAREMLGRDHKELGSLLAELERETREYRRLREEAARKLEELAKEAEALRRRAEEEERKRERLLLEARQEARSLVRRAQAEVKAIVRELRARLDEEGRRAADRVAQKAQEELRRLVPEAEEPVQVANAPMATAEPGQWVWVPRLGQQGQILALHGNREAEVLVGSMKLRLPTAELEALAEPGPERKAAKTAGSVFVQADTQISPSIMVRGLTAEEAVARVDKYLDEAVLAGLSTVVVIHGKGEGILRRVIHEYLKNHPRVKDYRLGNPGEGGAGVTVVSLA